MERIDVLCYVCNVKPRINNMKNFFNLLMTMPVVVYPLLFTSCEEDDMDGDKKNEQTNTKIQTYDIPPGLYVTSIKAYTGDNYVIENKDLGVSGVSVSIVKVDGPFITISVSGSTVTICDSDEYMSCVLYQEKYKGYVVASRAEAAANPKNVLFICQDEHYLVSGTESNSEVIKNGASKTYFQKWDYLF